VDVELRRLSQITARGWLAHRSDVSGIGTRVAAAYRVLTVFADNITTDDVMTNSKARVAIVERQLYVH
jgi:hypothetical protein